MSSGTTTHRVVEAVWRIESAKLVAALARVTGDVGLAGLPTMTDAGPPGGDDAARFALDAERHRRELQVHCYRILANYEDARDMTQETLLRAWHKRESFRGDATLRTWLGRTSGGFPGSSR